MIVLQVRPISESIRFRTAEWGCAAVMILWGITVLLPGHSFSNPSWVALETFASEDVWGIAFCVIGFARLVVLTRNGRWHHFNAARSLLSYVSFSLWSILVWALMSANIGYWNTGIPVYLGWLCLDAGSVFISQYDSQRHKEALRDGAA